MFRVETKIPNTDRKQPRVKITADSETFIVCTLAKAGYYSGDPDLIWESAVDRVLTLYDFETFSIDYENADIELNKPEEK